MQGQQDKKLKLLGALESKTCSHKRHGILCIESKIHRDHGGETIATDDLFRKTLQTQTDHD